MASRNVAYWDELDTALAVRGEQRRPGAVLRALGGIACVGERGEDLVLEPEEFDLLLLDGAQRDEVVRAQMSSAIRP